MAWLKLKINFSPKNQQSIGNLWIYNNILLKDDDGRIYKPPDLRKRNRMPKTFNDLPFPIINRYREDATLLRSINSAYNRIQWSMDDTFVIEREHSALLLK